MFTEAQRELGKLRRMERDQARAKGTLPPLPTSRVLRVAIRNKCLECMGHELASAEARPMADVRACAAGPASRVPCPLWAFRPWQ